MQDRQAQSRDVVEAVLVDAMRRMTDYAAERMRLIALHLEADEAREQGE